MICERCATSSLVAWTLTPIVFISSSRSELMSVVAMLPTSCAPTAAQCTTTGGRSVRKWWEGAAAAHRHAAADEAPDKGLRHLAGADEADALAEGHCAGAFLLRYVCSEHCCLPPFRARLGA
eukprot:scaffold3531_cov279-Prasinococcus_capsulatus_cf.AAC.7